MNKRDIISDKQELRGRIVELAKGCRDLTSLKEKLTAATIETYTRGSAVLTGAYLGKRRYRLTKLGITKEHFRQMSIEEERLQKLREKRNNELTKKRER